QFPLAIAGQIKKMIVQTVHASPVQQCLQRLRVIKQAVYISGENLAVFADGAFRSLAAIFFDEKNRLLESRAGRHAAVNFITGEGAGYIGTLTLPPHIAQ